MKFQGQMRLTAVQGIGQSIRLFDKIVERPIASYTAGNKAAIALKDRFARTIFLR